MINVNTTIYSHFLHKKIRKFDILKERFAKAFCVEQEASVNEENWRRSRE